jgi:hypothetical protein
VQPFAILCGTQTECASIQGSDRRTPYPQSIDLCSFIDQNNGIVQHETPGSVCFQKELMISGHNDFVPMWQFTEPIIEVDNCLHALGEHGEIASVDEDVAVRHIDLAMKLMRVAGDDKAQSGSCYRGSTRLQVPSHTGISGADRILGKIGQRKTGPFSTLR